MGCFGYICKGCNTPINGDCFSGGENAVLIHVRHGEELGRVVGHYNEYGTVKEHENLPESERFRGENEEINGHKEICKSEFRLPDSFSKIQELRIYKAKEVDFETYIKMLLKEEKIKTNNNIENSYLYNLLSEETFGKIKMAISKNKEVPPSSIVCRYMEIALVDFRSPLYYDFKKLEKVKKEIYSGIAAWHVKCYEKAPEEKRNDLTPSHNDPDQSWGKVRKKFL